VSRQYTGKNGSKQQAVEIKALSFETIEIPRKTSTEKAA